jgi:hypothetical protein
VKTFLNTQITLLSGYLEKYLNSLLVTVSNLAADKREKRLRNLANILSKHGRSDMVLTMGQLSLEFYRQAALAEGYFHSSNIDGAEGHRLIAEAIHDTLKTLRLKDVSS